MVATSGYARSRALRLLGIVATAALITTGVSLPASADTASITGTVLAADTELPVTDTCASAYDQDGNGPLATACTDSTGGFSIDGLAAGTSYYVGISGDQQYLGEYLYGADSLGAATLITAPAAAAAISLRPAIAASGTLTYNDGTPVANGRADFNNSSGFAFGATTQPDGTWSTVVAAGDYTVEFSDGNGNEIWAYGKTDPTLADVIHVVPGTPVVIDDVIPLPGSVHGRVVSASSGVGLPGICVTISPPDDPGGGVQSACTNATGYYTVTNVRPGTYIAVATDPAGTWAAKISAPFDIVSMKQTTGIRLALQPGASMSGKLLDAATGAPITGGCFIAENRAGRSILGAVGGCTGPKGGWVIKGLPTGKVILLNTGDATHPMVYVPLSPTRAHATVYSVTSGKRTGVPTIREPLGGSLTGTILAPDGSPAAGVFVGVGGQHPGRAGPGEGLHVAQTGSDGTYVISNLPQWATPIIVYPADQPYAVQWSGHAADPATATKIQLRWNAQQTFNAQLDPEARLSITVTGAPAGFNQYDPLTLSGAVAGFGTDIDGDGTATIGQLPTSSIKLRIHLSDGRVFYYDGATSVATATPIPVQSGTTTSITVTVPPT